MPACTEQWQQLWFKSESPGELRKHAGLPSEILSHSVWGEALALFGLVFAVEFFQMIRICRQA